MPDKGKGRAAGEDLDPDDLQMPPNVKPRSDTAKWPYLENLNSAQREAVTWKSTGGLQILAGPGSGKTRVLTCRVAYLIQSCGIAAQDLVVVTFTNKAANEMKHRLKVLLGDNIVNKIIMGTFHSVAVRYLRKYGKAIDLPSNFVIADQSDSQSILKPIVTKYNTRLKTKSSDGSSAQGEEIKVKIAQDVISKAKSKGIDEERYMAEALNAEGNNSWKLAMADVYMDYQKALRASNTLDFDDLLVFCERVFRKSSASIANIRHVLVDEFQDTNLVQYDILRLMSRNSSSLTIVGDPDQSIYAWRSAEVENLTHMLRDFHDTHQIMLEENYRSTSSILQAALAVVEQDQNRIQKSLRTSHPPGPPVVLRKFTTVPDEAAYIAYEIKRAIAHSGESLNYDDFAILLRYNALSRSIEAALQSSGIPSRMIGGHKFFDRTEVKDILAYLQLADNPNYSPAFRRIVNVPKRGIGDKALQDLEDSAKAKDVSTFEVTCRAVTGGTASSIKPGQRTNLKAFCNIIKTLKEMGRAKRPVPELIDYIVNSTSYAEHLERTHGLEYMTRIENINELKSFAEQIAAAQLPAIIEPVDLDKPMVIDLDAEDADVTAIVTPEEEEDTPLRIFLASSILSTDTETQDTKNDRATPKVTISTCHAAKGLEWPMVFLPAAETGVYPAFRKTDDVEVAEERRLFYVAMTRAQAMLHVTHCAKRMERGVTEDKNVTDFLSNLLKTGIVPFSSQSVEFDAAARTALAAVTGRVQPNEEILASSVAQFHASVSAPNYSLPEASGAYSGYNERGLRLHPSKPMYPGEAWRMNSYAGDQSKRYAAKLPNAGVNRFAGAFATSSGISAASAQAPGFTSALSHAGFSRPNGTGQAHAGPPSRQTSTSSASGSTSNRAFVGISNARPFRPPSLLKAGVLPTVNTVETRLTQQKHAVILNPVTPNVPQGAPYVLPTSKPDDFTYLRGLAKDESEEFAPRRTSGSKTKASTTLNQPTLKRSRS